MPFLRWLLVLLLLAVAASPVQALDVAPSDAPTRGLLWRIERDGHVSYLFGTIHSDDPRVLQLPAAVDRAFTRTDSFVMEALPSADGFIDAANAMTLPEGRTLQDVVGADLYQRARAALLARGQPVTGIDREKPWVVMAALSYPVYHGLPLDFALLMKATQAGKKTAGLETSQEQIAVFDGMSLADQTHLLALTVDQASNLQAQMDKLLAAWLARDLGALHRAEREDAPAGDRAYDTFMKRLTHERNLRMAERMAPYLKQGNAFIAVGALHLVGDDGLLRLLAQRGYRVERVY